MLYALLDASLIRNAHSDMLQILGRYLLLSCSLPHRKRDHAEADRMTGLACDILSWQVLRCTTCRTTRRSLRLQRLSEQQVLPSWCAFPCTQVGDAAVSLAQRCRC